MLRNSLFLAVIKLGIDSKNLSSMETATRIDKQRWQIVTNLALMTFWSPAASRPVGLRQEHQLWPG